jgi:hypothetical protein
MMFQSKQHGNAIGIDDDLLRKLYNISFATGKEISEVITDALIVYYKLDRDSDYSTMTAEETYIDIALDVERLRDRLKKINFETNNSRISDICYPFREETLTDFTYNLWSVVEEERKITPS